MRDFNQRGDSRGGFKSGGNRGFGRPSFGGDRDRRDHDRGPVTMHKATCATCGEACEVPFRPSGDKPVYCNACFRNTQGGDDRAPRKEFSRPSFAKGGFDRQPDHRGGEDNKRQFEMINTKLDQLTLSINRLVDIMAENKTGESVESKPVSASKKVAVEKPAIAKKSTVKKTKKS